MNSRLAARRGAGGWMRTCLFGAVLGAAVPATAGYKDLVGYPELQSLLGSATPTGAGIDLTQVEANDSDTQTVYMPNPNDAEFTGKTLTNVSNLSSTISGHANQVAYNLFGSTTSIASVVSAIRVYEAGDWIDNFLRTGTVLAPLTSTSRLANHSWIGDFGSRTLDALRRTDYLVDQDDFIQVVSLPNTGMTDRSIFKDSFNAISVGLTSNAHIKNTKGIPGSEYTAGRVAPTLVTPGFNRNNAVATSWSGPIVSAAVALLLETGQDAGLSNGTITNRTRTIHHAETSEVIKAVLMAGADRWVNNPRGADLLNYAVNTTNNLDDRYGAGQLNIFNSYRILAAGEQDSSQDGNASDIAAMGWDYDPAFGGGSSSNSLASYFFTAGASTWKLTTALVWNIDVFDSSSGAPFTAATILRDLDLLLIDVTQGITAASSLSTEHNTENILADLVIGNRYELRVTPKAGQGDFVWDYALAWYVVPEPASLMVLVFAAAGLTLRRHAI